jgi:hypothetical protein
MEKFDLERALAGEPVCTRDGRDVTQLTKFDVKDKRCLVGVVSGMLLSWTYKGDCFGNGKESKHDLVMKPKENAIWINLFKYVNGSLYTTNTKFNSKESAEKFGKNYQIFIKNFVKLVLSVPSKSRVDIG